MVQVSHSTDIYFQWEEFCDLKVFPKCFCRPLKTLWRIASISGCQSLNRNRILEFEKNLTLIWLQKLSYRSGVGV